MKDKRFIRVFIIFSALCQNVYAQTPDNLHQKISQLLQQEKLTGAVWTTVTDSDSIYTNSAGVKSFTTKQLLKPTDKVHVGSITKTIVALGILRLATQQKLSLDEPVKKYLPKVPFFNIWESTHPITVRNLLDHTSGLSDLRLWHFFSTTATADTALSTFYEKNHQVLITKQRPGTVFSYSNMGYTLLGMVIEAVTKQRYEDYLDQSLLKPLGMHQSTARFVSQVGKNADPNLAMGHFDDGTEAPALPIYLRPSGQFTTTAYDMGLLLRFLMSDGKLNQSVFIDSTYLAALGKPTHTIAASNGLSLGYGLGAAQRDRHQVIGISHSGNIIGYKAMFYVFPKEKKAFFIAYNMDSESANYEQFNETLIQNLQISKIAFPKTPSINTNDLGAWAGYYVPLITKVEPFGLLDFVGSFTKVEITNDGAEFKPFQRQSIHLHYLGKNLFRAQDKVEASHYFYVNEKNRKFITNGLLTLRKVNGWQLSAIAVILALGVLSILYVLFWSTFKSIKRPQSFLKHPLLACFLSILILLLAIPFMIAQPFMSIGDRTIGNMILALGTFMLPLGASISLFVCLQNEKQFLKKLNFWSLTFILLFCILLIINNLLPLTLWKQ
ncbi:serine hydrolase [Runella sp. MFBS21]|uniref:serine hydrolase domain-containing protein n=1 Tax=Runella sp. MFBS21 TaxID=3034018 RepID=UPI0023F9F91B|nr:serine hydrolase domain-containing protein [Runella sp. MFBS21]MDF7822238.1 serine hydrolase [Runella sp. MFBS21]